MKALKWIRCGSMAVTSIIAVGLARAQTVADPPQSQASSAGTLEEVVVTAEKSRESSQQAPADISVLSENDLADRGLTDIRSLDTFVPSLESNQEGTKTQLFVRGIGKQYDEARIPDAVGMVVDGVLVPQNASALSLFDLNSIEVLPGPQGTLYGSSAIGGIVQVTSNRPSREAETSLLLETGDYSLRHVTIVENDPVTSDWSFRAAFNGNYHGAYNNNGTFSDNTSALRVSSLYSPSDGDASLYLSASYSVDHFRQSPATYHPYPAGGAYDLPPTDTSTANFYPPNGVSNSIGDGTEEVGTVTGELDWRLGDDITLTYTPSFLRLATPGNGPLDNVDIVAGFIQVVHSDIDQIGNEFRLANSQTAKSHWMIGLYELNNKTAESFTFGPNLAGYDYLIHTGAYAAYGQETYSLSDKTKLTAGARASRDTISTAHADLVYPVFPGFGRGTSPYSFSDGWEKIDWKFGVEHTLDAESMIYATVQSGFNPGTFQGELPTPAGEVHPQTMVGYTVGSKNLLFGSRLKLNLEGFIYEYHGQIVTIPYLQTGSTIFYNVPRSRSAGVQLDSAFKLTRNTRIYATLGYLDAQFLDFKTITPAGNSVDYAGYPLAFAPKVSGDIGLEHIFGLGDHGSIAARVDSYASTSYWIVFDQTPGLEQGSYAKTDASLTYDSESDVWDVGLWVKNLGNNTILSTGGETGRPYPFAASVYVDPPRTYGLRFSYRFDHR